jgi:hypothetical protein
VQGRAVAAPRAQPALAGCGILFIIYIKTRNPVYSTHGSCTLHLFHTSTMHVYNVMISFLVMNLMLSGVYGDQHYSRVLPQRRADASVLFKRQTCPSGEFLCAADLGGGCCEIGATCATTSCIVSDGTTSCVESGQQVCGTNCCNSPLVCDASTLQCVPNTDASSQHGRNLARIS